ncbi:MAG: hypothetical protein ACQR33_00745 [Candidatus Saccharibacteria bacterium]
MDINIQWHVVSSEALPAIMGDDPEDSLEQEIKTLKAGGFTAQAARKEEQLRREAKVPADYAYVRISNEESDTYRRHFSNETTPEKYIGQVPGEIARKFAELSHAEDTEESVFSSITLWSSPDGEVLAVGTVPVSGEVRRYMVVQWGYPKDPTRLEDISGIRHDPYRQAILIRRAVWALAMTCYVLAGLSFISAVGTAFAGVFSMMGMYLVIFGTSWADKKVQRAK